ncbi:MAG: hypothetical protein JWP87_6446 [Labilithrix sp.]|nr:hypothetical protein [Labilithrix sp.]
MRNVVGILVAAAVGIHCSAPATTDVPATTEPEMVAAAEPAHQAKPRQETSFEEEPHVKGHADPVPREPAVFMSDPAHTQITSTVVDPDTGAVYAAGTFIGDVVIGDRLVHSRGDKDVFLIKVDAEGRVEWVRAVGSAYADTAPHVDLDDQARVNLIGMTKGEMDCGAGPLPSWNSDTFFFCVFGGDEGNALEGGVFPTGAP